MRRRLLVLTLALSLISSVVPASAAIDAVALRDAVMADVNSPNMSHVANLPHSKVVNGALQPATAQNGTDIEFTTLPITTTDEDGLPVTEMRDYALAGTYDNGLQIIDITDPTTPTTTSVYDCGLRQGDVQVFTREVEGVTRTYITYTMDNGYTALTKTTCFTEAVALGYTNVKREPFGTFIADITDPANPKTVSFVAIAGSGSHNQTVAPGGMFLYNSNSDIGPLDRSAPTDQTGRIEVIDISDFNAPKLAFTLPLTTGADSHDITFSADGTRAYTAALTHTLVLDTSNLAEPKVVGRILDPAVNIHHQSDPVTLTDKTTGQTRTFLVVTDELAGAAGNGVCPGGGLHVYDITGPLEAAPVKVGYWAIPDVRPATDNLTCTAHVLRLHPDEAIMTIAWYDAGVHVVDISGLIGVGAGTAQTGPVGVGMKELGYYSFPNSDTWSVKTNKIEEDGSMYLFGNDMARGLDVYRYSAAAPAATEAGTWLTPGQALAQAKALGAGLGTGLQNRAPYCLLRGRSL